MKIYKQDLEAVKKGIKKATREHVTNMIITCEATHTPHKQLKDLGLIRGVKNVCMTYKGAVILASTTTGKAYLNLGGKLEII